MEQRVEWYNIIFYQPASRVLYVTSFLCVCHCQQCLVSSVTPRDTACVALQYITLEPIEFFTILIMSGKTLVGFEAKANIQSYNWTRLRIKYEFRLNKGRIISKRIRFQPKFLRIDTFNAYIRSIEHPQYIIWILWRKMFLLLLLRKRWMTSRIRTVIRSQTVNLLQHVMNNCQSQSEVDTCKFHVF